MQVVVSGGWEPKNLKTCPVKWTLTQIQEPFQQDLKIKMKMN